MATQLDGKWIHRSFHNDRTAPDGDAMLAAAWAPPGEFAVATDDNGVVTGRLAFPRGIELTVTGQVTEAQPADDKGIPWAQPPSVSLTAVVGETEYRLRGWFIPATNVIVGTVLSVHQDLAKAPDGTLGSWVLAKIE